VEESPAVYARVYTAGHPFGFAQGRLFDFAPAAFEAVGTFTGAPLGMTYSRA
jgi:hypothetical protein